MGNLENLFSFQHCWTCTYLIYDISLRKYICNKTGKIFEKKRETVFPTECPNWINK